MYHALDTDKAPTVLFVAKGIGYFLVFRLMQATRVSARLSRRLFVTSQT